MGVQIVETTQTAFVYTFEAAEPDGQFWDGTAWMNAYTLRPTEFESPKDALAAAEAAGYWVRMKLKLGPRAQDEVFVLVKGYA